jgi:RNA polymerase sigma-70 factor (ECF subfamily)
MRCEAFPEKEACSYAPDCNPESSVHSVDFHEIVRLHWGQVFRVCLRITRNEHDAEDAAQDCFLRAFSHFQQFQGKAQFSTWLNSIARNSSLMVLRKRRSRQEIQMESSADSTGETLLLEPVDRGPDQLSRVLCVEGCALLIRSIAALPVTLRSAADLVILNELTIQEAGRILEISEASLKSRLFRARRRLSRFHERGAKTNVAHPNSFKGPVMPQAIPDSTRSKQKSSAWESSDTDLSPREPMLPTGEPRRRISAFSPSIGKSRKPKTLAGSNSLEPNAL